jgi:hypothetical protein
MKSDDNISELCYEGESTPLQSELKSKTWYWPNTSKEALALAMQVILF